MEQIPRIQCTVVDDGVPVVKADSFQITEEVADTFFLDFLDSGALTSRLRLQREMLSSVRDRLASDVIFCPSRLEH